MALILRRTQAGNKSPWSARSPAPLWTGSLALACLTGVAAGASTALYPSPDSPWIVAGLVALLAALIAWFRKPVWALYAAVFVVLLPAGLISANVQSFLNRSITVIALITWLFDAIARRRRVTLANTALLMLGLILWSSVTLCWAEDLSRATTTLQMYILRFAVYLFLVPNEIRTMDDLQGLMSILALDGWILILVSAGTFLTQGYTPATRLQVLAMNENDLGVRTLVALPGVLWLAMRPGQRRKALMGGLALAYLLLSMALVAMSGSRGSALSWSVTLLAFLFWKPTRRWGEMGLLILALLAASVPLLFTTVLERFAVQPGDTLLGGREPVWEAAWMLISNHPWAGVGIGNAPFAVMPYLRTITKIRNAVAVPLHNPILTIWAETGIVGLALYLGMLGTAIGSFLRHRAGLRAVRPTALSSYLAIVSAVSAGFVFSWIKGGGIEVDFSPFLILSLLLIPSVIEFAPSRAAEGDKPVAQG